MKRRDAGGPATYRLLVEYDGSRLQGWQRQGAGQTAQGVRTAAGILERVLREAGLEVLTLGGSGRTDAGVHALGQVAHLRLGPGAPRAAELQRILDQGLPGDVAVTRIAPCPPGFHARHDARARTYLYQVALRRSVFGKGMTWWVKGALDPAVLEAAWSAFPGTWDLSAFADLEPGEDPRGRILEAAFRREGSLLLLRVTAGHFLRRQVRRMVGAAVLCAQGKARMEDLAGDLAHPTPGAALRWSAHAAPAAGLFLEHVAYGDEGPGPLAPILRVP